MCVDPVDRTVLPDGDGLISVGVHPWNADRVTPEVWTRMDAWLDDPRVVAVGEVGLDRARGPEIDVQLPVFNRQVELAYERRLPLIVHCVRAADILLAERRKHPDGQWIYHGFRGKPALARQLLDAGIDLSFGHTYNLESYEATPGERRYRESD